MGHGRAAADHESDGLVRQGFAFMGDDWTFLSEEGTILGYAKPLFVRPHHRNLFPQLFAEKRQPLAPARLVRPLGRLATAAHPLISRHPQLAAVARRWWPEHMIVAPEAALPDAEIARTATLAAAVFLERSACQAPELESRDADWMASRLFGDFMAELPRLARELQTALAAAGLLPLDRLLAEKARILRSALADAPCFVLRLPEQMHADEAAEAVARQVEELLESTLTEEEVASA